VFSCRSGREAGGRCLRWACASSNLEALEVIPTRTPAGNIPFNAGRESDWGQSDWGQHGPAVGRAACLPAREQPFFLVAGFAAHDARLDVHHEAQRAMPLQQQGQHVTRLPTPPRPRSAGHAYLVRVWVLAVFQTGGVVGPAAGVAAQQLAAVVAHTAWRKHARQRTSAAHRRKPTCTRRRASRATCWTNSRSTAAGRSSCSAPAAAPRAGPLRSSGVSPRS
jgi:hypothetical protein